MIRRSASHSTIPLARRAGSQVESEVNDEEEVEFEEISNPTLGRHQRTLHRSRSSAALVDTRVPHGPEELQRTLLQLAQSQAEEKILDHRRTPVSEMITSQGSASSAFFEITTTTTTTITTTVRIVNPISLLHPSSADLGLQPAPVAFHSCTRPLEESMDVHFGQPQYMSVVDALSRHSSQLRIGSQEEEWVELTSGGEPDEGFFSDSALAIHAFDQTTCASCAPEAQRLGLRAPPPTPRLDRRKKVGLVMRTMTQKLTRRRTTCQLEAGVKAEAGSASHAEIDRAPAPALSFTELPTSPPHTPPKTTGESSSSRSLPTSPRPLIRAFSKVAHKAFHPRSKIHAGHKRSESACSILTPPLSLSGRSEEDPKETVPHNPEPRSLSDPKPMSLPSRITDLVEEDEEEPTCKPALSDRKSSNRSRQCSTHTTRTQAFSPSSSPPMADFPPNTLVRNLAYFMRFSSAAYGQQFLRIMGLGQDIFDYPNTAKHSANHHAFASHVGLPVDQIIFSSFADPARPLLANAVLDPLVHYVAVDHSMKAVVLTCRGTLGLSDLLVDLTCEYERIDVEGGDPEATYLAHSGMLHSASSLVRSTSLVHENIRMALEEHPDFGLVITGHSLGGGVAALLAVLCSTKSERFVPNRHSHPAIVTKFVTSVRSGFPPGRPIHAYTYGTPAVGSPDLGMFSVGLVTSVINGIDIVPSLSLGMVHDLKNMAFSLDEEKGLADEIVRKVVCGFRTTGVDVDGKADRPEMADWLWSLMRTIRAGSDAEKLYPPGEVWHVEKYEVFTEQPPDEVVQSSPEGKGGWVLPDIGESMAQVTRKLFGIEPGEPPQQPRQRQRKEARRVILRACDDVEARFSEPIFGRSMIHDHLPTQYEHALGILEKAVDPSLTERRKEDKEMEQARNS